MQNHNKAVIGGATLTYQNKDGETERLKISSVGHLIDNALEAIEADNTKLKGVLNKRYTQLQIDQAKLGELIDLIATVPFKHASLNSKDILGHVYEYMLGQFALAEGKKGGQFYTPKSIVSLIVQMLEPFKGRVYDPAMGSGGFFVQSEHFIREHQGKIGEVSIYGQEYNHTTWQLAAMNMAIRGIDFNFGKEPANTFTRDQHPDLRADFVMANPPFNMKEWDTGVADDDPRWRINGEPVRPPTGNANFAWLLHMLHHLAPNGSLGLLLANGSMSSNTNNEGDIRRKLIENDLVECMVALPGQLFTNTQIPACIWFLTKNKSERTTAAGRKLRSRKGEVLFIDARNLGYMKDRVLRDFAQEDLNKVADTYHNWQTSFPHPNPLPEGEGAKGTHSEIGTNQSPLPEGEGVKGAHSEIRTNQSPLPERQGVKGTHSEIGTNQSSFPEGEGVKGAHSEIRTSQSPLPPGEGKGEGLYANIAGFCFSATLADIQKHDFVLTPGRYVGAAEEEDDCEPFAEKMRRLTAQLKEQFEEGARLEAEIKRNLKGLGYEF